jgi:hypothetical protein
MKGIEPIMDQVKHILDTELSAWLNLVDADHIDFALPDIAAVYIEAADSPMPQYPCIYLQEVMPELTRASGLAIVDYFLAAIVYDEADAYGIERLSRRLWRYERAIGELMRTHQLEPGYWTGLGLEDIQPSPPLPTTEQETTYGRRRGVLFKIQTPEDY